jgi:hypothetical protein
MDYSKAINYFVIMCVVGAFTTAIHKHSLKFLHQTLVRYQQLSHLRLYGTQSQVDRGRLQHPQSVPVGSTQRQPPPIRH